MYRLVHTGQAWRVVRVRRQAITMDTLRAITIFFVDSSTSAYCIRATADAFLATCVFCMCVCVCVCVVCMCVVLDLSTRADLCVCVCGWVSLCVNECTKVGATSV